ncbi:hypothetical protein A0H81_05697 [Grifola frondosa]|uniref:Peptidase S33 tripeptidyl aminopeptidase-like C-terminal domain-containing protein n=1 Tax=Grifola frondosa TaxID=5627 RepID=A0A1C7MEE6_GRIFR|nr:hypothetical protein A0H81_05697 [Grifola frondosa]
MDDVFNAIVNITRTTSPMFGAWWPVGPFYCPFWPVRAVERYTGPFNSSLANPILVIGNTDDPITPFEGAQTVADLLGDKATLIRQNGFGHSSFAGYSSCVIDIVRAYMENGTLPLGDDTVCDIDNSFELFPGVTTAAVLANITNIGGNMSASAVSDGTF